MVVVHGVALRACDCGCGAFHTARGQNSSQFILVAGYAMACIDCPHIRAAAQEIIGCIIQIAIDDGARGGDYARSAPKFTRKTGECVECGRLNDNVADLLLVRVSRQCAYRVSFARAPGQLCSEGDRRAGGDVDSTRSEPGQLRPAAYAPRIRRALPVAECTCALHKERTQFRKRLLACREIQLRWISFRLAEVRIDCCCKGKI